MTEVQRSPTGARSRLAAGMLAASLLTVELLAGMQRYVSQTVLPLLADELDGTHLYGPLDAAAQAPTFLMLPVGAWLLVRFRIDRLLLGFTALAVLGSVACALAPSMGVFLAGTAVRAVAGGALATISMGAVVAGLPARHRQLVLAGMSGTWVVSSLVGPVYAVAVAETLGWRWAMVLYLPLLVAARAVAAQHVPARLDSSGDDARAPWGWAVVLAAGVAVLTLPVGPWAVVALAVGVALVGRATAALLPAGTLRARGGRRAGLTALLLVAAAYFGATLVLSVVAHDALGLGPAQYGVVLAAPGLVWAVCGLRTGARPALEDAPFRRRARAAAAGLVAGAVVLLATVVLATTSVPDRAAWPVVGLTLGGALLGAGMGTLYPDLLGRCLARPAVDDGLSDGRAASAVVLAESVGLALASTVAFSWLGTGFGLVDDAGARAVALYAVLLVATGVAARRLVGPAAASSS